MEKFPYDFSTSAIRRVYISTGNSRRERQPPPAATEAMDPLNHSTTQRKTAGILPARPLAPR